MICGLDLSTSIVGISLINDNGTFHSVHHIELKKIKSFYHKVDAVLQFLVHELNLPHDVIFYVEAPLLMFKMRASMAGTLALLQKFNACVCYGIYKSFGIEPILVSVISARKQLGIELPKKKKKKEIKPMVFEFVKSMKMIPEDNWQYKRTGTPKDYCYDRCDAFVVAYSSFLRYHKAKANVNKT